MISESLVITIITAILGPSIVLYIANRIKNRKPKPERIDTAFDMYETIAKRQDFEITRLNTDMTILRDMLRLKDDEIARLKDELNKKG